MSRHSWIYDLGSERQTMKCKWIKKLTAGIIFLAAVGSLSGCQKAATSENLFRDIEVNMTSVESAEENQIVKLQMGDGDSAISQESNLGIEMIRDPAAVHRKGQQKTNMAGTKETQEMESYQVEEDGKTVIYSGTDEAWEKNAVEERDIFTADGIVRWTSESVRSIQRFTGSCDRE